MPNEKRTVLIVDDEPGVRTLMTFILQNDYQVLTAESADQAMQVIGVHNPPLVITDVKMPGKDGLALLSEINAHYPDTLVILMTGHGQKSTVISAVRRNAFDFLEKPFSADDLFVAIHRAEDKLDLMTRLREAEAQNIQADKIYTFGMLFAGVIHDISSPLSIISLYNKDMSVKAKGGSIDAAVVVDATDRMDAALKRITAITGTIRNLSRDGAKDAFTLVNLLDMVNGVLIFCPEKLRRETEIGLESPADLSLYCQSIQVSQIMLNLILNALDAVSNLPEKWIKIVGNSSPEDIIISVIDSGTGVTSEMAAKLMTPFYTSKAVGKGTGIGLNICKQIAEAHKGKLYLDKSATYTTFVVQIPKNLSA